MTPQSDEQIRASRGLLTVATIRRLVGMTLGVVPVLCIAGRTRSGKTWAAQDWTEDWNRQLPVQLQNAAYVDCMSVPGKGQATMRFRETFAAFPMDEYPRLALDGIDIVVVDEPATNPIFVRKLVAATKREPARGAHQLVILLTQDTRHLQYFRIPAHGVHVFDTDGLPRLPGAPR